MEEVLKRIKQLEDAIQELPNSDRYSELADFYLEEINEIKESGKLSDNPNKIRDMSQTGWR